MFRAFAFAMLLTICGCAAAAIPCIPGVPPTADFPQEPVPPDEPYKVWRLWGWGNYWYCFDKASGKYSGWYTIAVPADLLPMLTSTETLDTVMKQLQDQFRSSGTPAQRRALVEATIAKYSSPTWHNCDFARANNLQPYKDRCEDVAAVSRAAKPADLPQPSPGSWVVKKDVFRADGKRAIYTTTNGKEIAQITNPTVYVDMGSPCNPEVTIVQGQLIFMSVLGHKTPAGQLDFVAVCVRLPVM